MLPIYKECNLLHQLTDDYLRYRQQGFIDAAVGVLRLIQSTAEQVIQEPDLFKEESIEVVNRHGVSTLPTLSKKKSVEPNDMPTVYPAEDRIVQVELEKSDVVIRAVIPDCEVAPEADKPQETKSEPTNSKPWPVKKSKSVW